MVMESEMLPVLCSLLICYSVYFSHFGCTLAQRKVLVEFLGWVLQKYSAHTDDAHTLPALKSFTCSKSRFWYQPFILGHWEKKKKDWCDITECSEKISLLPLQIAICELKEQRVGTWQGHVRAKNLTEPKQTEVRPEGRYPHHHHSGVHVVWCCVKSSPSCFPGWTGTSSSAWKPVCLRNVIKGGTGRWSPVTHFQKRRSTSLLLGSLCFLK